MTVKQIIDLDCREEESNKIIQKYLKKIKPLSKWKNCEVPIEKIEKTIVVLSKKYKIRIRDIVPDIWANKREAVWRVTIIDDNTLGTVCVIYGISLYEVLAKVAICMYSIREEIGERQVCN